jgi:hypothetical protein
LPRLAILPPLISASPALTTDQHNPLGQKTDSHADTNHGLSEIGGDLGQDLGVVVMRDCLDDRSGPLGWVSG